MNRYIPVAATTGVQILAAFAALAIPSLAPVISGELKTNAFAVGPFVSTSYAAAAISTMLAGILVPRLGPIRMCQAAMLACACGLLAAGRGSLTWLFVGAVWLGLGYGPVTPASSQLLAATTSSANRRLIFSLKQTGVPAGAALAGAIMPIAVSLIGWCSALGTAAFACLIVAVVLEPVRRALDGYATSRDATPRRGALLAGFAMAAKSSYLRRLCSAAFVLGGAQMCGSTFIVSYFVSSLGYPIVKAGLMLTIANLAGVVFRLVWGAAADRRGDARALLGALSLAAAAASFIMADGALLRAGFWAYAAVGLFGATAIGWNGVLLAEVAHAAEAKHASAATAVCQFCSFAGVTLIPLGFGALIATPLRYTTSWAGVGALCLITGATFLPDSRAGRRPVRQG
ncbi:MFS transporter [Paraburkholderia sacchari]|uniref:MFS transporter n=1 Tax=Paraburkholderia sacchari TaxID=159450 RepID=UPI001BCD59A9